MIALMAAMLKFYSSKHLPSKEIHPNYVGTRVTLCGKVTLKNKAIFVLMRKTSELEFIDSSTHPFVFSSLQDSSKGFFSSFKDK